MMAKGIIVVDNIPSICKKCDYLDRSFLSESYCIASMSSIKITDGENLIGVQYVKFLQNWKN